MTAAAAPIKRVNYFETPDGKVFPTRAEAQEHLEARALAEFIYMQTAGITREAAEDLAFSLRRNFAILPRKSK